MKEAGTSNCLYEDRSGPSFGHGKQEFVELPVVAAHSLPMVLLGLAMVSV